MFSGHKERLNRLVYNSDKLLVHSSCLKMEVAVFDCTYFSTKNIDWIDTDIRLTAKTMIRSMVVRKKLKPMDRYYRSKIDIFFTYYRYYSIGHTVLLKCSTDGSIPSVLSTTDSIDLYRRYRSFYLLIRIMSF